MNRIDEIAQQRNDGHWNLVRFRSKVYDAAQAVEEATFADGTLSRKTKELIAVGIAIQSNSEPCIQNHVERAAEQGAPFEEVLEAIEVGIEMGGALARESARFAFLVLDRMYSREILKI
jgi:AhpD family alkylhydroperoxidase